MTRPSNFGELAPEIQKYIVYLEIAKGALERKVAMLEDDDNASDEDAMKGLYHALRKQLHNINKELSTADISFAEKNDKRYDRFWKAMVDSKDVVANLLWIKKELKINDPKAEDQIPSSGDGVSGAKNGGGNARNPIEDAAFKHKSF